MRHDDVLHHLAKLVNGGRHSDPDRLQPALERQLTPMVRLALRKGIGVPALVNWVRDARRNVAAPHDIDACANTITRWLTSELIRRKDQSTFAPMGQTRL